LPGAQTDRRLGTPAKRERQLPVTSKAARRVLTVLGALLTLVGLLWIGQGSGIVPGTVMSGNRTWLVIGLVSLIVGVALIVVGVRRRRTAPSAR
jgi:uncharacterized membrane protein